MVVAPFAVAVVAFAVGVVALQAPLDAVAAVRKDPAAAVTAAVAAAAEFFVVARGIVAASLAATGTDAALPAAAAAVATAAVVETTAGVALPLLAAPQVLASADPAEHSATQWPASAHRAQLRRLRPVLCSVSGGCSRRSSCLN